MISEIYYLRAEKIEKTESWVKAIPLYEKALTFDPGRAELYEKHAKLYFLRVLFPHDKNQISRMEKILIKGIYVCPNNAALHMQIGLFYEAIGKEKKALSYYNKAILLDPNNGFYHATLAAFYIKNNIKDKGIKEAKKAVMCSNLKIILNFFKKIGINIKKTDLLKN